LRLTETGRAASDVLDLPSMAEKIIPTIKDRVADKIPYDVQEFCFEFICDKYQPNHGDETRIKQYAHDNELDRDDILDALAIILRDKLLELKGRNVG